MVRQKDLRFWTLFVENTRFRKKLPLSKPVMTIILRHNTLNITISTGAPVGTSMETKVNIVTLLTWYYWHKGANTFMRFALWGFTELFQPFYNIKDNVQSVLHTGSAHNKARGSPNIIIDWISHLLNFFSIETLVYTHLQAQQTR